MATGRGWLRIAVVGALAALAAAGGNGCAKGNLAAVDEANPYYQTGEHLRATGQFSEAVRAFERCLVYSPQSTKAHWQAAAVCAESLHDWPRAVVHYRACVAAASDDATRAKATAALQQVEAQYYAELAKTYAPPPPPPVVAPPVAPIVAPPVPVVAPVASTPVAAAAPAAPEPRIHVVKTGDTLTTLARQYYGDGRKWGLILEANRDTLSAPEKLHLGQRLIIPPMPDKDAGTGTVP